MARVPKANIPEGGMKDWKPWFLGGKTAYRCPNATLGLADLETSIVFSQLEIHGTFHPGDVVLEKERWYSSGGYFP